MSTSKELKDLVKNKYGSIADQSKQQNQSTCCGPSGCCDTIDYTVFSDDYSQLSGYEKEADLGLGCGLPTEFAQIRPGDHVLDLGSGAGNDCFVARALVGDKGRVTGIDFTDEMIAKAEENKNKLGFTNVAFVKGDIENMPIADDTYDVVISNCVLNLVPDKEKAFKEINRVLKPGGHFCISDVVIIGELPDRIKEDAEMYAGCVAGAIQMENYLQLINQYKFTNVSVKKEKRIDLPNSLLLNFMSLDELRRMKKDRVGIFSITVVGEK